MDSAGSTGTKSGGELPHRCCNNNSVTRLRVNLFLLSHHAAR